MTVRLRTMRARHRKADAEQPSMAGPLCGAAVMALLLGLLFMGLSGWLPDGKSETVVQVSVAAIAAAALTWFVATGSEW